MGQLQRTRDAIEQGVRDNDTSAAQWDRWVEYADVLHADDLEIAATTLDACVDDYTENGDHHGAAVARHIRTAINSVLNRSPR